MNLLSFTGYKKVTLSQISTTRILFLNCMYVANCACWSVTVSCCPLTMTHGIKNDKQKLLALLPYNTILQDLNLRRDGCRIDYTQAVNVGFMGAHDRI